MRLFVAVELSDAIQRALLQAQRSLQEFERMVRWVRGEQMHLTLKFLGEVPDDREGAIARALDVAATACRPFEMSLRGAGCFPPRGKARVIWVGLEDAAGRIAACQGRVEQELEQVGFAADGRLFTPHLTLGRVRDDRSNGQLRRRVEALAVPEVEQEAGVITLMQSELTPHGARYNRRGVWRLGGGDHMPGA